MFGGSLWAWALFAKQRFAKQKVAKSSERSASDPSSRIARFLDFDRPSILGFFLFCFCFHGVFSFLQSI